MCWHLKGSKQFLLSHQINMWDKANGTLLSLSRQKKSFLHLGDERVFHKPTIHNLYEDETTGIFQKWKAGEAVPSLWGWITAACGFQGSEAFPVMIKTTKSIHKTVLFSAVWWLSYQGISICCDIPFYSL